jgi:hypothetical protein
MARAPTKSIPASFVKLDSTVTQDDEYVNVRDLQVARGNHNILLAEGSRRMVWSQSFYDGLGSTDVVFYGLTSGAGVEDQRANSPIIAGMVFLSPYVQTLECYLRASGNGTNVTIYVALDRLRNLRDLSLAGSTTYSGATTATFDIPVPNNLPHNRHKMRVAFMNIYVVPETGSTIVSAKTIVAVTSDNSRIEVNDADLSTVTIGDALYFDSDTTIPARIIIALEAANVNTTYLRVDKPFGPAPTTSDTWAAKVRGDSNMVDMAIYEKEVTDFDGSNGGL